MRIQNNIPAVNSHRYYNIANNAVASSTEKLSSGFRINRAGDDAAGLAISEKMRAQIRGLQMASKNSSDAISMIQTAEGALQSSHNILQRMRELAVQAGSDTNEQVIDRGALDLEFQQLKAEIDEIAQTTRFNDQNLIDGTFQKKVFSLGTALTTFGDKITGISVEAAAKGGDYALTVTNVTAVLALSTTGAANTISNVADFNGTVTPTQNVIKATASAWTGVKTSDHNGNAYTLKVDGASGSAMTISLIDSQNNTVASINNVDATAWANTAVSLTFQGVGSLAFTVDKDSLVTDDAVGAGAVKTYLNNKQLQFSAAGVTEDTIDAKQGAIKLSLNGEDVYLKEGDTQARFTQAGITLSFKAVADTDTGYIKYDKDGVASVQAASTMVDNFKAGTIKINSTQGQNFVVQSGANQGDELGINIDAMNTARLNIAFSKISTRKDASSAITEVNSAINKVSTQRAVLGALQNRLDFKISNLDIGAENLQAAESRIRDVDMAKEMTAFSKKNIITQAATAMLAQANSAPQNVLQLLR